MAVGYNFSLVERIQVNNVQRMTLNTQFILDFIVYFSLLFEIVMRSEVTDNSIK